MSTMLWHVTSGHDGSSKSVRCTILLVLTVVGPRPFVVMRYCTALWMTLWRISWSDSIPSKVVFNSAFSVRTRIKIDRIFAFSFRMSLRADSILLNCLFVRFSFRSGLNRTTGVIGRSLVVVSRASATSMLWYKLSAKG